MSIKKLRGKLRDWLGISQLEKDLVKQQLKIQRLQSDLDIVESVVNTQASLLRDCTSVSSDIHMNHNKGSIIFVAGRYRNKDYVRLFNLDHDDMPQLIDQLKFMEEQHTRGYYDTPFQCDMSLWLDR